MTEKPESYETEIDGEDYLVTPGLRKERDVYAVEQDPQGDVHAEVTEVLIQDPGAREWKRITRPAKSVFLKGVRPPGDTRLCANDRCTNLVPESKNPGVERIFCCRRCAMRYHQRMYTARERGQLSGTLELTEGGRQFRFNRKRPKDPKVARERYLSHLERGMCPNATEESRSRCPAHMLRDQYSEKRLCLIFAVLVDDWKEAFAKDRGELYYRQWTTGQGEWKETEVDDPDLGIHLTDQAERTRRMEKLLSLIGHTELDRLEGRLGIRDEAEDIRISDAPQQGTIH